MDLGDVERAYISALANSPENISQVGLTAGQFKDPRLGWMFKAIFEIIQRKEEPDLILITEILGDENFKFFGDVLSTTYSNKNFKAYERGIITAHKDREIRKVAQRFSQEVSEGISDAGVRVIEEIKRIETGGSADITDANDHVEAVIQFLDDVENGLIVSGLTTGLRELDLCLGGLKKKKSYVLAARTSVGKTAMAINLACNVGVPSLFISGEMDGIEITQRIMSKLGGISAFRMSNGRLRTDEYTKLATAVERINLKNIKIVDKPRPSIDDIERLCREAKWKHDVQIAFVDYLQLINHHTIKEKRLAIADISSRLKGLAGELDIPIVTLAQLNRNAAGDRKPMISDLKESGSIEEDADVVILLYPSQENGMNVKGKLQVDIQKHRGGPKASIRVNWENEFMRASDDSDAEYY